jgi:uncharacterized protein (DUF488 family)
MSNSIIYSIGYQMRSTDDFIAQLKGAGISAVVDVRETPWSHRPGYSAKALSELLTENGIEYVPAKFAGNPKVLRTKAANHAQSLDFYADHIAERPDVVEQFDQTIRPYLQSGKNVCLLCYERHPADCHRAVLAHRWQVVTNAETPIIHLDPSGATRFTTYQIETIVGLVSASPAALALGA